MIRSRGKNICWVTLTKSSFQNGCLWTRVENNELLVFLFLEGESAIDIHRKLVVVYEIFIIMEVSIVTLQKKETFTIGLSVAVILVDGKISIAKLWKFSGIHITNRSLRQPFDCSKVCEKWDPRPLRDFVKGQFYLLPSDFHLFGFINETRRDQWLYNNIEIESRNSQRSRFEKVDIYVIIQTWNNKFEN